MHHKKEQPALPLSFLSSSDCSSVQHWRKKFLFSTRMRTMEYATTTHSAIIKPTTVFQLLSTAAT